MQKPFLPEDLVPKSFMDQFGSLIKCALGGWDRLRFHACLRPLFSPQWMRTYLCAAKVRLVDFATHAQALTERVRQAAQNDAAAAGRPYHFLRSTQRRGWTGFDREGQIHCLASSTFLRDSRLEYRSVTGLLFRLSP